MIIYFGIFTGKDGQITLKMEGVAKSVLVSDFRFINISRTKISLISQFVLILHLLSSTILTI